MPRRPEPLEIKEGKGTVRRSRVAKTPPARVPGNVEPPKGMSADALTCWRSMTDLLRMRGQLTLDSAPALERLCRTYAECCELERVLEKDGRFQRVKTQSGSYMKRAHPAMALLADADRRYRGWLTEFGLTDASRGKVQADPARAPGAQPAAGRPRRKPANPADPAARYGLN